MQFRALKIASILIFCTRNGASSGDDWLGAARNEIVSNDAGGYLANYVDRVQNLRSCRQRVTFAGRCDSSCTLLLSLPSSQLCITPGAASGFHAPSAPTESGARAAQAYLMSKYPGWVRNWIASQGGLTSTVVTMDYAYPARFIRTCG